MLNGGGQVDAQGDNHLQMGTAAIAYYEPPFSTRRIYPQTWTEFDYGQPVVSNFIRTVAPASIDATVFGTARLHPPEPIIPETWRSDVFGATDVSHRIRNVYPTAIDPLEITSSPGFFKDRMKVKKRFFLRAAPVQTGERFGTQSIHF